MEPKEDRVDIDDGDVVGGFEDEPGLVPGSGEGLQS